MNEDRTHDVRITSLEGEMISVKGRLDGHDATLAAQGKWLSGYEDELGEHDGAIAALQKIAAEVTALMASVRIGFLWAGRLWKWVFRPVLICVGTFAFSALAWILTHISSIVHGLDKLNALLSK